MAKYDLTTTLRATLKKAKITAEAKAVADLLILGWDKLDAAVVTGIYSPAYSHQANLNAVQNIINTPEFASYTETRLRELLQHFNTNNTPPPTTDNETSAFDYRSKEAIIEQLGRTVETLKGKERADVLMKIADLQQMKKEEVREEEQRIHFYLPANCNRCPHAIKYGKPL